MANWHMALGIASGAVQVYSIVPYIKSILKGQTRPNVVSWSLWLVLQVIAIAGQISSGASWSLFFLFAMLFNIILVLSVSAKGYGYKKYGWVDFVCLASVIAAIAIWKTTGAPVLAISMAVVADFIALVPTVVKTWKEPASESAAAWFILVIAAVLAVFSTAKYDAANLLYPGYSALSAAVVAGLAYFGQRKKGR
jgi:hypothetical protein